MRNSFHRRGLSPSALASPMVDAAGSSSGAPHRTEEGCCPACRSMSLELMTSTEGKCQSRTGQLHPWWRGAERRAPVRRSGTCRRTSPRHRGGFRRFHWSKCRTPGMRGRGTPGITAQLIDFIHVRSIDVCGMGARRLICRSPPVPPSRGAPRAGSRQVAAPGSTRWPGGRSPRYPGLARTRPRRCWWSRVAAVGEVDPRSHTIVHPGSDVVPATGEVRRRSLHGAVDPGGVGSFDRGQP